MKSNITLKLLLDYPIFVVDQYRLGKLEHNVTTKNQFCVVNYLLDIRNSLFECYQKNATWVMNLQTYTELSRLKNNGEDFPFSPKFLLSKAVTIIDSMPEFCISYGDYYAKLGSETIEERLLAAIR